MSDAAIISITLDKRPGSKLAQQLYRALLAQISKGLLQPGFRMPSSRQFAEELGISRSTVITAYDQLVSEGFLQPIRGSGLYVLNVGEIPYVPDLNSNSPKTSPVEEENPDSDRPLPFSNGVPDMRLFPYKSWAMQVSRVARQAPKSLIENETGFGDLMLRSQLAKHLHEWRGIPVDPQQIIITAGALDAVELILRTLVGKEEGVAIEDPGYLPIQYVSENIGAKPHYLNVDLQGAIPPQRSATNNDLRAAVLTPSFQFPLGITMPSTRKHQFLEWARRQDSWIIEDDFDSEFRYSGQPVTALTSHDRLDRVIYVGSFSKIFSSGLRIGFIAAPFSLLNNIRTTQSKFGTRASSAPQRALAGFLESGEFHRHLRKMRRVYGARRANLIKCLKRNLGELVEFHENNAGMQVALIFKQPTNDVVLADAAFEQGMSCAPLTKYYRHHPAKSGLILGYCSHSEAELEQPIANLCALVRQYTNTGKVKHPA